MRFIKSFKYSILEKSSDPTVIRSQDEATIINDVAFNANGRKLAFDYLENNWDTLFKKYFNFKQVL